MSRIPATFFVLLLSLAAHPAKCMVQEEIATARDLESRNVLFKEQHIVRFSEGEPEERLVIYRCLDGKAFARKRVRYADIPSAPSFQLEDARSGYREGAERTPSGTRVSWTAPGGSEASMLLPAGDVVADAGFDEWVRGAWDPLTQGQTLPMRFLVPSRLRAYDFDVASIDSGSPGLRAFRLRLGGWFGWLVPAIRVAYDAETKRLRWFEGLSNLRDDSGESPMQVRIDFPPQPTLVDQQTFDVASAESLTTCTVLPA